MLSLRDHGKDHGPWRSPRLSTTHATPGTGIDKRADAGTQPGLDADPLEFHVPQGRTSRNTNSPNV
jgi:hypothetical protein